MFNKTRLTVARQRASMTMKELADKVGVEPRAVTGFEAGEYNPTDETKARISKVLGYPPAFFEADDIDIPDAAGVSFRAMTKMTARQRDAAIAAGALAYILIDWVEDQFQLPDVDLPDLREETPEMAATSLRQYWAIGERPIKNMVHLLEAKGVRVFSLVENCLEIDAYSVWRGRRPCVFLNTGKSAQRGRFDAAHELGHLVLHRHAAPNGQDAEKEANRFAAAFLMPEGSMKAAGRIDQLDQVIDLKKKWQVSVAAMVYRLHELGMMSKWTYQTFFVEISRRGWRTSEPFATRNETSQVWQKVFAELRKERMGVDELASKLSLPSNEIVKLVFGLVTVGLPSSSGRVSPQKVRPSLRLV